MTEPQKRALVVGVAEYGNLGETKIPGALRSARAWRQQLLGYGYLSDNITLLEDARATKQSVLKELERLFKAADDDGEAGKESDVMFLIACHGTSIPRDGATGEKQQGLVLYPTRGDTLLDATLFGDEIAATAAAAKHGDKIQFNVGLDACFSGGIHPPTPAAADDADLVRLSKRLVPLRIIAPGPAGEAPVSFVEQLSRPLEQHSRPSTVTIAACAANEDTYEGEGDDGKRWTLFSEAALQALGKNPDHSYRTLVEEGVHLPDQTPMARGSRRNYHFARRTVRTIPARAQATHRAETASTLAQQATLDVLIVGISCIANAPDGAAIKKRVLFPTDNLWYPLLSPHLGFVEIEEGDLLYNPGTILGLSERYTRFGRSYRRFELSRHKITIDDIDPTQGYTVNDAYGDHVPQMLKVQPNLSEYPRPECYLDEPPASLVTGHFDITYGVLDVGRVASKQSEFKPTPPNTWPIGYPAISVQLRIKINAAMPTIRVQNLDTGIVSVAVLKPTAGEISIGNLSAPVLAGDLDSDDPPHDFKLFYNLAETDVDPKPVPNKPQGIETACTPVNWP
jgi:hypothetical protein